MMHNDNNATEEELDKYLNEINSDEELNQSDETFHGKESPKLLDDDDDNEVIMKEGFLLNFTHYEREIEEFPNVNKSQEIGTDLHIDNDEQILKQLEESLIDAMSVISNGDKNDSASGLLELLKKEMLTQDELHAQKTESLQRIGQMHESDLVMGSGKDKTDNKFLDDLSENDATVDFEGWSNYQAVEMKLAEKELLEFMNQKNEIIENLKKQLFSNEEEVQKYREILAIKIQKMFRGFRCRKIHGESLRKRMDALKHPKENSAEQTLETLEKRTKPNIQELVSRKKEKLKTEGVPLDSHEDKEFDVENRKEKDIQAAELVEITTARTDSRQQVDILSSRETTLRRSKEADNNRIVDDLNKQTETTKESHDDTTKPTSEAGVNGNLEMDHQLEVQERRKRTTAAADAAAAADDDDGDVDEQSKIPMQALIAENSSSIGVQGQMATKFDSGNSLSNLTFESQTSSNQVKTNSNKTKGENLLDTKVADEVTKQTYNAKLPSHSKTQHVGVTPNKSTKLPSTVQKSSDFATLRESRNKNLLLKVVRNSGEREPRRRSKEKVSSKEDKNSLVEETRSSAGLNDEAQSEHPLSLCHDNSFQLTTSGTIQVNDNSTSPDKESRPFQGASVLDLKELILKMEHQWRESAIGWSPPAYEHLLPPNELTCPSFVKQFKVIPDHVIFHGAQVNNHEQITCLELSSITEELSMRCLSSCSSLVCLSIRNSSFKYTEGLNKCPNLQFVDLSNNRIEFMNFSGMKRLLYLNLQGNAIKNIHNVDGCRQLKYLNLSQNSITRLTNMESLTALQYLNVSRNQLTSVRGLLQLRSLQFLDLSNNFLSVPLRGYVQDLGLLSFLNISNNMLDEVPVSANNILLMTLNLDENDLGELKLDFWLPHLTLISSRRNRIMSIGSLKFCQQLETLDLAVNLLSEFDDIVPSIVNNLSMRNLTISNNPLNEDDSARDILRDSLPSLEILNEEKLERTSEGTKMNEVRLDRGMEFEDVLKEFAEQFQEMINFAKDSNESHLKKSRVFPQLSSKCRSLAIKLRRFHETGAMQDTNDDDDHADDLLETVSEACQQTTFETNNKSTEKVEGREVKYEKSLEKNDILDFSEENVDDSIVHPNNSIIRPDNNIIRPDNNIIRPDNSVIRPDNNIIRPDNNIIRPDNSIIRPDNNIIRPDNNVIRPDNNIIRPDNNIIRPDNSIVHPNNNIIRPDNSVIRPDNSVNLDEGKQNSKVLQNVRARSTKRQSIAERIKRGQPAECNDLTHIHELHHKRTASSKLEFEESMKKMASMGKDNQRREEEMLKTAAIKIQALWRGHRLRGRIREALKQVRMEFRQPHDDVDIVFKSSALNDTDEEEDDDGVDSYGVTRPWKADYGAPMQLKPKPRARKLDQIRQAWMEPSDNWSLIPSSEKVQPIKMIPPHRYGNVCLPSELCRRQSLRAQHSAREEELIKEWGFKDETTKELFLRRLRKIEKCQSSASSKDIGHVRRVISAGDVSYRKREVSSARCRLPRIESPAIVSLPQRPSVSSKSIEQKLPSIIQVSPCERSDVKKSTGWGSGRKRKVLR